MSSSIWVLLVPLMKCGLQMQFQRKWNTISEKKHNSMSNCQCMTTCTNLEPKSFKDNIFGNIQ